VLGTGAVAAQRPGTDAVAEEAGDTRVVPLDAGEAAAITLRTATRAYSAAPHAVSAAAETDGPRNWVRSTSRSALGRQRLAHRRVGLPRRAGCRVLSVGGGGRRLGRYDPGLPNALSGAQGSV